MALKSRGSKAEYETVASGPMTLVQEEKNGVYNGKNYVKKVSVGRTSATIDGKKIWIWVTVYNEGFDCKNGKLAGKRCNKAYVSISERVGGGGNIR